MATFYRNRDTGEVFWKRQIAAMRKDITLPSLWNDAIHDMLNVDPAELGPRPEYNSATHRLKPGSECELVDGKWLVRWDLVELSPEEQEIHADAMAKVARKRRDMLLFETDYLALADSTLTPEMAAYRQALRDITNLDHFPFITKADWPAKPE